MERSRPSMVACCALPLHRAWGIVGPADASTGTAPTGQRRRGYAAMDRLRVEALRVLAPRRGEGLRSLCRPDDSRRRVLLLDRGGARPARSSRREPGGPDVTVSMEDSMDEPHSRNLQPREWRRDSPSSSGGTQDAASSIHLRSSARLCWTRTGSTTPSRFIPEASRLIVSLNSQCRSFRKTLGKSMRP